MTDSDLRELEGPVEKAVKDTPLPWSKKDGYRIIRLGRRFP